MIEFVDIWDDKGLPTGKKCTKQFAHEKGLFHPTVHVWFYTSDHNILMQKRSSKKQTYPNFWDVSVAGHIASGETIHQGAIREIKEEIGLTILHNDLEFITIRKNVNKFSSGIIDCEFQHVFLAKLTTKIDNLNIQKEEIDDVRLFSFDEIIECQNFKNSNYKIVPADMTYYTYIIDIISKKNQSKSTQDQHL